MWTTRIYTFFCDAFRPPYRAAGWLVLLYLIVSVIFNPESNFNRASLPDTDDYTRLVQVFNWLDGHSWFDMTLNRLYPQHPVSLHWSRLPDLPLAGLIITFEALRDFFQIEIARVSLARLAAFIVPCGLLVLLFALVRQNARFFLPRPQAGLSAFVVPLCMLLIFQFTPLRVDHHAYILLSAAAAFFCLQALLLNLRPLRMAGLMALAMALGLWNGAEILPMLAITSIALSAAMVADGRRLSLAGPVFGLCLLGFTGILLPISRPPAEYGLIAYDAFSLFYVLIALAAAAYFLLLGVATRFISSRLLRGALALFLGVSTLALFLKAFPDFIFGPYAKAHPLLNVLFFPNIREAVPFYQAWTDLGDSFGQTPRQAAAGALYYLMTRLFVPLVGLLGSLYGLFHKGTSPRQRRLWALAAGFCAFYTGLAFFWQIRVITYAQLFTIAPFTWLLLRYLKNLSARYSGRALYGWELLTILSFTVIPVIMVPAIIGQSKLMPDVLFYLGRSGGLPCPTLQPVTQKLQQMEDADAKEGKPPLTILAPMDYTPALMFYTRHNFIAAPYHRNDRGIIDALSFYRSLPDDRAARQIARRLDLDYVLVCKASFYQSTLNAAQAAPASYAYNGSAGRFEAVEDENATRNGMLGVRMAAGYTPSWLTPVPIQGNTEFAFFKVNKAALR